jgi:PAS domain S-box-containing protein
MSSPEQQSDIYRLLVEHSLGLMCVHDLDGTLLSINSAVANSLGYRIEDGLNRNLSEFLAPAVRDRFNDYLRRIRENGRDSGVMHLLASDGTERFWSYRNIRYDRSGEPPIVLGHAIDVTNRLRAERALKEAQIHLRKSQENLAARIAEATRELEQSNERLRKEMRQREELEEELLRERKLESLGVLAGGIAHDFNNYLTVIQGNISLAKMDLPDDHPVHRALDQGLNACNRAAALASQLLIFGKGGAPVRRVGSVEKVIRYAATPPAGGPGAQVSIDIAPDLWAASFDAKRIAQALENIIQNAGEAMPEAGVIEIRAVNHLVENDSGPLPAGRYVAISVRDYGCGIDPEIVPRIFDPYFTTKETGTGLGLATAHSIVAKHDGRITVDSTPGAGTTFTIYLPASVPTSADAQRAEPAPGEAIFKGSGRILVMDDEEGLRMVLWRVLTQLGYEVECAADGAEAIELYQKARDAGREFNAVLVDLTVPGGMGGIETAAHLRRINPNVKLIVSSGYSDAPVMSRSREYGFDEVIPKPWTPRQISEAIHRVLPPKH